MTSPVEHDLRSLMEDHLSAVESRLADVTRLRGRLVQLIATSTSTEETTGDLLNVLADITMLETRLTRRISILVSVDMEAAT